MRNLSICFLILNFMILSSWEGLNTIHTLLHQIPNPFHSHENQYSYIKYQHGYFHHHEDHHHKHSHSFDDHVNIDSDKKAEIPFSKKNKENKGKKFFKINYALNEIISVEFFINNKKLKTTNLLVVNDNTRFKADPPVPPPEIFLLYKGSTYFTRIEHSC